MLWQFKFARDMTYDRKQLLRQKLVTVIGFIDLSSQIPDTLVYSGVAQFRHVVCHRRTE